MFHYFFQFELLSFHTPRDQAPSEEHKLFCFPFGEKRWIPFRGQTSIALKIAVKNGWMSISYFNPNGKKEKHL